MVTRRLLALLLLASGLLFAVGSQIERNTESSGETKVSPVELRHDTTTGDQPTATEQRQSGESPNQDSETQASKSAAAKPTDADKATSGTGSAEKHTTEAKPSDTDEATKSTESAEKPAVATTSDTGETATTTGTPDAGKRIPLASPEAAAQHRAELHREARLFGINPEAVGLVIAAVLASLLLAIAIWMWAS